MDFEMESDSVQKISTNFLRHWDPNKMADISDLNILIA